MMRCLSGQHILRRECNDRGLAFLARFNQLFGNVTGDFQGFGDRPTLGNESRNVMGCGEVEAFGEFFDLEGGDLFHGWSGADGV
jgi:hypothetical protein